MTSQQQRVINWSRSFKQKIMITVLAYFVEFRSKHCWGVKVLNVQKADFLTVQFFQQEDFADLFHKPDEENRGKVETKFGKLFSFVNCKNTIQPHMVEWFEKRTQIVLNLSRDKITDLFGLFKVIFGSSSKAFVLLEQMFCHKDTSLRNVWQYRY